jgi:hypothetical protein
MVARPGGVRRAMLIHWAAYRALRSSPQPDARDLGFVPFLLQRWQVEHLAAVPGFAAGRIAERYRARRRRSAALATRV